MKKTITLKSLTLLAIFFIAYSSYAQTKPNGGRKVFGREVKSVNPENGFVRCASTEYEELLQEKNPERLKNKAFETWIAPKIAKIKADQLAGRNTNAVITIPVVVHVIHSGQAIGVTRNITDLRVQSQITVLNQDYRRLLSTPGYNNNAVGADIEIEFCLVKTGPDGELTTGINRVNLGNTTWNESNVENILKPQTQWDPSRYFNIWVCQFGGNLNGVLGYAQFPTNSGLSGLNADGGSANTDGVIIDYRCFGTSTISPSATNATYMSGYDKGRTATHEVGHALGLRHIWGDAGSQETGIDCSGTDYCNDTPVAGWENYDCATVYNSCPAPGNDMTENYMDYTNDVCMNVFTLDQKARIQAVLQNSIRRANLKGSTACNTGQTYQYNGRLKTTNLNILNCNTSFAPTLNLANKGTVTMTSAVISYSIDNGTVANYNWTGSLATNAEATVTLPSIVTTPGSHTFNSSITAINGANADQFAANNTVAEPFALAGKFNTTSVKIEIQRDIYGSETAWTLTNITTGATLASGVAGTDTETSLPALFTQTVNVVNNNCYKFTINDSAGDGICCDYGEGYYNLKTSTGAIIITGGAFGTQETKNFSIDTSLSNADFNLLSGIKVYPNPAKDVLNIEVPDNQLPENYTIYNNLGQILANKKINTISDLRVNTSSFSSGIYIIKINKEGQDVTLRFIKN